MNILFITGSLQVGGAQSFLLRLASFFKRQGHNVFIYDVHPKKREKEILSHLSSDVPIINAFYQDILLRLTRFPLLRKIFQKFIRAKTFDSRRLFRFIRKNNIQVINTHLYLADLYISKLHLKTHVPIISSWHGCYNLLWDDYSKKGKTQALKKQVVQIFKNFTYIIFAAEKHKEAYNNLGLTLPYTKIYYGFEKPQNIIPAEFSKDDAFVFGMIARGDPKKGWAEAIEAFKQLKEQINKPIKLVLVGWSEFLAKLKTQNTDTDIIFAGQSDNPLGWIYHFDAGLLPTYFPAESLPNTIIEYLAMQKPVIATNWAEIPQMIDSPQGKAGILIPLTNGKPDIKALSDAMLTLIQNKKLYSQLTENTKFAFEKFSMQRCAEQYLETFERLISSWNTL